MMARKSTGSVVTRKGRHGTVYALRFRAYGRREYVTLGSPKEGWTEAKAHEELENTLAAVRLGVWEPPSPDAPSEPTREPIFREFAAEWFTGVRNDLAPATVEVYEWAIGHLLPAFGERRISDIGIEDVDRYRRAKIAEREAGMGDAVLSNESINKTITRLGQIMDQAMEYGLVDRNPARGKNRKAKVTRKRPTYLGTSDQIVALLDAVGALNRRVAPGRDRALVATLMFAGLRIGESLALRRRDLDLASGRLTVQDSKTEAGLRDVNLLPVLRDELTDYVARGDWQAGDLLFGTRTGGPDSPSGVRNRVIGPATEAANQALEARGLAPMPERITPHSLRRTFASLLVSIDENPAYVMGQMGHTDAAFTLRIYAQIMNDRGGEKDRIRSLVNGADWARTGTNSENGAMGSAERVEPESGETATASRAQTTRAAGFEPATSCSGGKRSIH